MKNFYKVLLRIKELYYKTKGLKLGKDSHIGKRCSFEGVKNIRVGTASYIGNDTRLACFEIGDKKPQLIIGDRTLLTNGVNIICAESVTIGNDCMIAAFASIVDEDHGIDLNLDVSYEKQKLTTNPVHIGNNVWIGQKACILKGVRIGDNSIIGAGAIVTKDVPKNSIVAGNPARIIKKWENDGWIRV